MTAPTRTPPSSPLMAAARRGMEGPQRRGAEAGGFSSAKAKSVQARLLKLGMKAVGRNSTREDLEDYVKRIEEAQVANLEPLYREWLQHLYYIAGEQYLAYHRDRRRWIVRRALPWRVRSRYNVIAKAQKWHVARLTENKPTVTVQSRSADLDDLERAESKEMLFWYLWDRLAILKTWQRAQRIGWACGCAILKTGFDANAGGNFPATKKRPRIVKVPDLSLPPDAFTGEPQTRDEQIGTEEYYIDSEGNDLGPVEAFEKDEATGEMRLQKQEVPEGVAYIADGEAYIDCCWPGEVLWDPYVAEPEDSWFVLHRRVLPLSRIAASIATTDEALERLKEATEAEDDGRAGMWTGLFSRDFGFDEGLGRSQRSTRKTSDEGQLAELDREFKVCELWVFPKNADLKALWGEKGAIITTVGGVVIGKPRALPEWALASCPFIKLGQGQEEGNHYDKAPARDVIPLQDDINRTLSNTQEGHALKSRMIIGAPQNAGINVKLMSAMPGVLLTYRSPEMRPEPIKLDANTEGWGDIYATVLAAANDLSNTNEASTGKLPSAGLSAKALYSLQYADERSISEASALQDMALKRLAESLDAITRVEYTEARKIRLVGEDRSFMVEHEITPEALRLDVDYTFLPGSMLSRQKEAVRNELLALKDAGLITPQMVLKHFPTATPDVFRVSFDLQQAAARNMVRDLTTLEEPQPYQPQPWENPAIFASVLEEFMLTVKFRKRTDPMRQGLIMQTWQTFKQMEVLAAQGQAAPMVPPEQAGADGSAPGAPATLGQGPPIQEPPPPGFDPQAGAQQIEQSAKSMAPPAQ